MGRIHITSEVAVAVAPATAWAVIADFSRNPEWQGGMRSCQWVTPPPLAVGSRYEQVASFLGRTIATTFEVVALAETDDHASVTIDSVVSTFPLTVTRSVVPAPGGVWSRPTWPGNPTVSWGGSAR